MSGTCCYCDGACHPDSQSCSACMRQGCTVPSRQPLRKSEFGVSPGKCCYCKGSCHPDSKSCSKCMRERDTVPSCQPLPRAPSPRKSEFGVCYYCGGFCKKEYWNCGHPECAMHERVHPAPVPEAATAEMVVEEESDTQYEIEARALEIAITLLEAQIRELKRRRVAVLHKRIALIDI
jgi:hypothetical protein